jgi:hypothetical protein
MSDAILLPYSLSTLSQNSVSLDNLFQIGILGGVENFGKKFAIEWA